jgi:hypothetical protein
MLTMEEGPAFLHAVPAALEKNRAPPASVTSGCAPRRVSAKAPHLGWCWRHNHHTWVGVAAAGDRLTVHAPEMTGG